jgi:peptidylprolyl isomerase
VEEAYGPRKDEMVVTMQRSQLPPEMIPTVGQRLELTQMDDSTILVTVTAVTDTTLTIDANHPLAGKALTFELKLDGIV